MGRAPRTSPEFPNTRGKARAPPPSPEQDPRLEAICDEYILSALLKVQLNRLVRCDFVKKFRSCLNRKTRPEEDRVTKRRQPRKKTIGTLTPALIAKFADLVLRIAGMGEDCNLAHSEQRWPLQQPARRSSAIFSPPAILGPSSRG